MQSVQDFSALMVNALHAVNSVMKCGTAGMEKMSTIAMRVSSLISCTSTQISIDI